MLELQHKCSMPLGQALARFELHWDDAERDEQWCRRFTNEIGNIIQSKADATPGRPYRGDVWLSEQTEDARLDAILLQYDRRLACSRNSNVPAH